MKGVKNLGSSRVIRQCGDYVYLLCGTKTKVKRIQNGELIDDLRECKMPCDIAYDKAGGYVAISDGKYGRVFIYKQGMPHEPVARIKLPCKKEKYIGLAYDDLHCCFLAGVEDSLYCFTTEETSVRLLFKNEGSIFWGFSQSKAGLIAFLCGENYNRDAIVVQCYNEYNIRAIKCADSERFVTARHRIHYCDDGTMMLVASNRAGDVLKVYNVRFEDEKEITQLVSEIQCNFISITNCSISPNKSFLVVMGLENRGDVRKCELKTDLYDLRGDGKLLFSEKQTKYETAYFYGDSMNICVAGSFSAIVPIEACIKNE